MEPILPTPAALPTDSHGEPAWTDIYTIFINAFILWAIYLALALVQIISSIIHRRMMHPPIKIQRVGPAPAISITDVESRSAFGEVRLLKSLRLGRGASQSQSRADALYSEGYYESQILFQSRLRHTIISICSLGKVVRTHMRKMVLMISPSQEMMLRLCYIVCCFVVCSQYVAGTYTMHSPRNTVIWGFFVAWTAFMFIFMLLAFLYAEFPLQHIFSFRFMAAVICVSSLVSTLKYHLWLNVNFLHIYLALKMFESRFEIVDPHHYYHHHRSSGTTHAVSRLIAVLSLQFLTFIFISTSFMQLFELLGDMTTGIMLEKYELDWANTFYFAVVALATVGFGDFVPYTMLGRLWISFFVLYAAYLISKVITRLIELMGKTRHGTGIFVKPSEVPHVLVTGNFSFNMLQEFVKEFFTDSRNEFTKLVVLHIPNPPWTDEMLRNFLSTKSIFLHETEFLEGSCMNEQDLLRVQASKARGIFVLSLAMTSSPHKADSETLKRLLALRRHCPHIPIYSMHNLADSYFQFKMAIKQSPFAADHGDEVSDDRTRSALLPGSALRLPVPGKMSRGNVPVSELRDHPLENSIEQYIKYDQQVLQQDPLFQSTSVGMDDLYMAFLGESIFSNGMSTLLSNLIIRVKAPSRNTDRPWMTEYKMGLSCQFEYAVLPAIFHDKQYKDVFLDLMDFGILLFAHRQIGADSKWNIIKLDTLLQGYSLCMIVTYHSIDKMDMIMEDIRLYFRDKWSHVPQAESGEGEAKMLAPQSLVGGQQRPSAVSKFVNEEYHPTFNLGERGGSEKLVRTASAGAGKRRGLGSFGLHPVDSYSNVAMALSRSGTKKSGASGTSVPMSNVTIIHETEKLPVQLLGHVVLCLAIDVAIDTIPVFLKKVMVGRPGLPNGVPLVIIRMESTPTLIKELERFRSQVYLILGNPFSTHALRKAQFRSSRAIISLSAAASSLVSNYSADSVKYTSDSAVMFMALTLDHLLEEDSNVFPCALLSSEESLKLIPTPGSYRRRGIQLGETAEAYVITSNPKDELAMRREPSEGPASDFKKAKGGVRVRVGDSDDGEDADTEGIMRTPSIHVADTSGDPLVARAGFSRARSSEGRIKHSLTVATFGVGRLGMAATRPKENFPLKRGFSSTGIKDEPRHKSWDVSAGLKLNPAKMGFLKSLGSFVSSDLAMSLDEDLDRDDLKKRNLQQAETSRELVFERIRYASGEVIIPSIFVSLLVREYQEFGFGQVVKEIVGGALHMDSWIRVLDVPEKWVAAYQRTEPRTYRHVCQVMMELGCIPLGLYRSGDAPVRIEVSSTVWQRGVGTSSYESIQDRRLRMNRLNAKSSPDSVSSSDGAGGKDRLAASTSRYGAGSTKAASAKVQTETGNWTLQEELQKLLDEEDGAGRFGKEYNCPSSKRNITFEEILDGQNVLPYVYTMPEPYTEIAGADAVFVLCPPSHVISCHCWKPQAQCRCKFII